MAILTTKLKETEQVALFFEKTKQRIKSNNLVKNPFEGDVAKLERGIESIYIVKIEPVYFPFPVLLLVPSAVILFIFGWTWWVTIPLAMSCLSFFWSDSFFKMMLKKGLRKAGVKQPVTFMKNTETIKEVVFNVPKRCNNIPRNTTTDK